MIELKKLEESKARRLALAVLDAAMQTGCPTFGPAFAVETGPERCSAIITYILDIRGVELSPEETAALEEYADDLDYWDGKIGYVTEDAQVQMKDLPDDLQRFARLLLPFTNSLTEAHNAAIALMEVMGAYAPQSLYDDLREIVGDKAYDILRVETEPQEEQLYGSLNAIMKLGEPHRKPYADLIYQLRGKLTALYGVISDAPSYDRDNLEKLIAGLAEIVRENVAIDPEKAPI